MASMTIRLTVDSRFAIAWIRTCRVVAYVVPSERLLRVAKWGAVRLIRFRMDDGPWRWGIDQ